MVVPYIFSGKEAKLLVLDTWEQTMMASTDKSKLYNGRELPQMESD